jgi:hypothetical protein
MANIDSKRLALVNNQVNKPLHTCPLTRLQYWSDCVNFTCPANISAMNPGHGGCFLRLGKPTIIDASRLLRITTHEVKRRYRKGMKRIGKFLQFYQWLQDFRDRELKPHCQQCGVILPRGHVCINVARCSRRVRLLHHAKLRTPMKLVILSITNYEFWEIVLAENEEKFKILPAKLLQRALPMIARIPHNQESNHAYPRQNQARQIN